MSTLNSVEQLDFAASVDRWWTRKSVRQRIWKIAVNILLSMGSVVILFPFFWMVTTALKDESQVYLFPPVWIPNPIVWRNFVRGWTTLPFTLYFANTLITTVLPMVGIILSCSLVAFSFAKLRWSGRNVLFIVCLSTMMLPPQVTMIPRFILFKKLGWINTFYPLIVPHYFGIDAFYVFLLRQFYLTMPPSLEDAAKIDGCSLFQIWYKIMLPLSKPAIGAISVFTFLAGWRNFLGPLIYLNSPNKRTLMLGLLAFQDTEAGLVYLNLLMAVGFLTMIPCLLLFFFAQKYFIRGVVFSAGLKG